MTINSFIPEVWAARLLANLNKNLVFGQAGVINRDYEGDISRMGDTVHINGIGTVTIRPYTKNQAITAPETLSDAQTNLLIDQGQYFNFAIDDADKAQTSPKVMDAAMAEAAYGLAEVADDFLCNTMVNSVSADNKIGSDASPENLTAYADAYGYLIDMSVMLNEANVPKAGRWIIVPPWFVGMMAQDDRFTSLANSGSTDALLNSRVARVAGFDVLESNSVYNDGTLYKIVAGYPGAVTYAEQVSSVEAFRPDDRFADAVKGLHIYGAKVVRPSGLALMTCNRPD